MHPEKNSIVPLVYSCSGCSSAAQMANAIAVGLDQRGVAEMSCIAGVGGHVKALVKTAMSGRKMVGIDGCPLQCVRACLAQHGLQPHVHYDLSVLGVKKTKHGVFDPLEASRIEQMIAESIIRMGEQPLPDHKPTTRLAESK